MRSRRTAFASGFRCTPRNSWAGWWESSRKRSDRSPASAFSALTASSAGRSTEGAMDLRSGCLFWTKKEGDHPPHAPPLDCDITADVAILGAGITGAMAAHYLVEAGVETVLVDRRDIARGSTAASTGLLQYELDKPLVELAPLVGERDASRAYQLGKQALDEFEHLTQQLGDDCGFARTRSLLLATDAKSAQSLREEARTRTGAGLAAEFLSQPD